MFKARKLQLSLSATLVIHRDDSLEEISSSKCRALSVKLKLASLLASVCLAVAWACLIFVVKRNLSKNCREGEYSENSVILVS